MNAGDKDSVKEVTKNAKFYKDRANDDLKFIMSNARGRRFMHELLANSRLFAASYVPGDSHTTAFHEGMRAIGRDLLARIDGMPKYFNLMMDENREDQNT